MDIPGFVGYFTVDGPTGYIEVESREAATILVNCILTKYPKARAGKVRRGWWSETYTATIWTRASNG